MASIEDKAKQFMELFNADDLDGVIASLTPDAAYVDPYGAAYKGRDNIRQSLVPYFSGEHGVFRYGVTEVLADEAGGRALIAWNMEIHGGGATTTVNGLDILHFEDGLIASKNSFCKANEVRSQ